MYIIYLQLSGYLHVGKKLSNYLHMGKTSKSKRRRKAAGHKIQQEAHVPVILSFHLKMSLSFHHRIIAIVIVITLRAGMGLQEVEGGEGEASWDRELLGRELHPPFLVKKVLLIGETWEGRFLVCKPCYIYINLLLIVEDDVDNDVYGGYETIFFLHNLNSFQ